MSIYLGLGANLGDRRAQLGRAVRALEAAGFEIERISPVVESPALVPPEAKPDWHRPYLNLALAGRADWQPEQARKIIKQIEQTLGRVPAPRWSPRPIDIDLLLWHDETIETPTLSVPHPDITRRPFVLTPLLHIAPEALIDGRGLFDWSRSLAPIPLWMAVLNLTPDSFSDGGRFNRREDFERHVETLIESAHIIDLGAESTRPGATPLGPDEEWQRLRPALEHLQARLADEPLAPWLSIDSRHTETLKRALPYGIRMLNDVGGLADPELLALARDGGMQVVAMHHCGLPAAADRTLPEDRPALPILQDWMARTLDRWLAAGLPAGNLILDPGIGFGKTLQQNLELLQHCGELRRECRLLIGHSRKSWLRPFAPEAAGERDPETLGASLALVTQGADILRVHDPALHRRAYRGFMHATAAPPQDLPPLAGGHGAGRRINN